MSDYKCFYLMATSVYSKYTTIMLFAFFSSPSYKTYITHNAPQPLTEFGKPSYIQILVFFPSSSAVYRSTPLPLQSMHCTLVYELLSYTTLSFWLLFETRSAAPCWPLETMCTSIIALFFKTTGCVHLLYTVCGLTQ